MKYKLILWSIIGMICIQNSLCGQDQIRLKKGDLAYNFKEIDDENNEVNLKSYEGKIVLINFTATFCGPCWNTYSQMDELQKKYKDKLKIISFHMDDEKELWKKIATKKEIKFDVASIWRSNTKKEIYDIYQANGFPYFVIINHKGIVVKKWFGDYSKRLERNLRKTIKKIN